VSEASNDHSSVVLHQLREHVSDGVPAATSTLPHDLYMAILSEFGSIFDARRAAGLPANVPPRRRWSRETIIAELRRLDGRGVLIRYRDLNLAGHSGLLGAARALFGSLARARQQAGIRVTRRTERRAKAWDEQRVIAEINALRAAGKALASSKVDPRLQCAARRYFGTFGDAIEAAGVDYGDVRLNAPSCSVDELLDRLRALAAEQPAMTASALEDHAIAPMLRWRFPTVAAAVRKAGIRDWPRRERRPMASAEETLAAIRARGAQHRSLARTVVVREQRSLVRAAVRHYGTWREAVAAADHATRRTTSLPTE